MISRPLPPEHLLGGLGGFEPSPELARWVRSSFIEEGAPLENPDHGHLLGANIGFVWTNEPNTKKNRMVLGECQLLPPGGPKWSAGRAAAQLVEWFGDMPDFLITIYAPAADLMDDATFAALVEHELYHASQATDQYGVPKFDRETGKPVWSMRGHDIEQFVGVVRRYGADASGVRALVEAANNGPEIDGATLSIVCGTCK